MRKLSNKAIKRMYDCPDKPYAEHSNHIYTSFISGQELWNTDGNLDPIITTRAERQARAFWAGFNEGALPQPLGSLHRLFEAPLQFKPRGRDLRHIL